MVFKYKKKTILGGITGGLTYALIQSLFAFLDNENFDARYFFFNFIFFGIAFGFFANYQMRKNEKKNS